MTLSLHRIARLNQSPHTAFRFIAYMFPRSAASTAPCSFTVYAMSRIRDELAVRYNASSSFNEMGNTAFGSFRF
jgi:hypothetical protein